MLEDLLMVTVLAFLGRDLLRERLSGIKSWRLPPIGSHPYYRIAALTALLLAVGWANSLATLGPKKLAASLRGEAPPPGQVETERCLEFQRMLHYDLQHETSSLHPCPFGGELRITDDGFLECRRHGRDPGLERVRR